MLTSAVLHFLQDDASWAPPVQTMSAHTPRPLSDKLLEITQYNSCTKPQTQHYSISHVQVTDKQRQQKHEPLRPSERFVIWHSEIPDITATQNRSIYSPDWTTYIFRSFIHTLLTEERTDPISAWIKITLKTPTCLKRYYKKAESTDMWLRFKLIFLYSSKGYFAQLHWLLHSRDCVTLRHT